MVADHVEGGAGRTSRWHLAVRDPPALPGPIGLPLGERGQACLDLVDLDINRIADELAFLRDGQVVLRTGRDELSESWRRVSFRRPSRSKLMSYRAA